MTYAVEKIAIELTAEQARRAADLFAASDPELAEKIRRMVDPKFVIVCAECRNASVEWECWIDANTEVNLGDAAGENYCHECDCHGVSTIDVEPADVGKIEEEDDGTG